MVSSENREAVRGGGHMTDDGFVFELSGGALCLDFINTREPPRSLEGRELLACYVDLVRWGEQAGAVTPPQARALKAAAEQSPSLARSALTRSLRLRELLADIFAGYAARQPATETLLAPLNDELGPALSRLRLERRDGAEVGWTFSVELSLDRVLWPVLRSAAELLTSDLLTRLRQCDGQGCTWLFLDRSKNGSRRWCDMTVCGNRAKVRRHRMRQRDA